MPSLNKTVQHRSSSAKSRREILAYDAGMDRVDTYLTLADRPNTQRSYAAATRHFEVEWRGLLPATPDSIARYLADYAASLSINTLRARLAGLSHWHIAHGFADPTRSPLVARVLKGIRAAHNVPEKQARPLNLLHLQQVVRWLDSAGDESRVAIDRSVHGLRQARDQAMLLIGFWRGFRADELTRIAIENTTLESGKGLLFYLPQTKGDRDFTGRSYRCPALSRLCPVAAYERWITMSGLKAGPVFRRIDRWGRLSDTGLAPGSIAPWLRGLLAAAGVDAPDHYSSHSLRRGFAGWARVSGWDIQELMEYVGWRDVGSAMRYLDGAGNDLNARFEVGLSSGKASAVQASAPPAAAPKVTRPPGPKRSGPLRVVK